MKALVPAGGKGNRVRPGTHTYAKQLALVANRPLLFYGLEALWDAQILNVCGVVGDKAHATKGAAGDGNSFGLTISYIHQSAPLGLARAVLVAAGIHHDEDFLVYFGDDSIIGDIVPLVMELALSRPDARSC